jgi:hypothetical protein
MKLNNKKVNFFVFASSLFLAACGSDSGSVTEKPDPAKTLTEADFNNQTFIIKGNEQVADSFTFFSQNKTGTEFSGTFKDKLFAKKSMTWEIKSNKLNVTHNGGVGEYSFSREKLSNNIYTGRKNGKISYLYKALPLKLSDLDGKIFQFDLKGLLDADNPRGCTVRTLKVVKNKAYLKEVCKKVTPSNILVEENVVMHPEFANTARFSFIAPNKDTILMALTSGNLKKSAGIVLIYQGSFKAVQNEKMKMVSKEAF